MPKICSLCDKKHYALGFCNRHWKLHKQQTNQQKGLICQHKNCQNGKYSYGYCLSHYPMGVIENNLKKGKICHYLNCSKGIYAKNYCRNHRGRILRGVKNKNCEFPNCKHILRVNPTDNRKYCTKHIVTIKRNKRHNLPEFTNYVSNSYLKIGAKNNNWKGGVSKYQKHGTMKRVRRYILKQQPICSCGNKATTIHHIDGSTDNHDPRNLIAVCISCHFELHGKKAINWEKFYGFSGIKIMRKTKLSYAYVKKAHKNGTLAQLLKI